jgi:hypothetical protein
MSVFGWPSRCDGSRVREFAKCGSDLCGPLSYRKGVLQLLNPWYVWNWPCVTSIAGPNGATQLYER